MNNIKVRFIPMDNGEIEGLYKSYGVKIGEVYSVLGFGDKVFVKIGNKIIDVFPSRLEIVE